MRFSPKSESEVSKLFEKGNYQFEVIESIDARSKNGNEMIQLKLKIQHHTFIGKATIITCYLMADNPNFEFLLRHFCYSTGLENEYENGELSARSCLDKFGIAKIGIEEDKTGKYQPKNKVLDFIEKDINTHPNLVSSDLNDDIPWDN